MTRCVASILAALVLLAGGASAQAQQLDNPQTVTTQDSGTACSVTLTCATFTRNVANAVTATLQVTGTWTGTLTFEATTDGSTWVTVIGVNVSTGAQVTTTTANGAFAFANVGFVGVRARATAAMTGTAFVAAARGAASARLLVPGASLASTFSANAFCLDFANVDACLQRQASGILNLTAGVAGTTFTRLNFGTAIAGNPSLKVNGTQLQFRLADDSAAAPVSVGVLTGTGVATITGSIFVAGAGNGFGVGNIGIINTNPTSAGLTFCTTPTVTSANGTAAFVFQVGTGCASSTGTITLSTATNGWVATCHNVTAPASNVVEQTGGTSSTVTVTNYARTTGVASNWTDSNVIRCHAWAY